MMIELLYTDYTRIGVEDHEGRILPPKPFGEKIWLSHITTIIIIMIVAIYDAIGYYSNCCTMTATDDIIVQ
jgi:hypothetical protein